MFSLSLSDHDCIGCIRAHNCQKYQPKTIKIRNYSKYDPKEFCKEIREQDWDVIIQSKNVNSAWTSMKETLLRVINKHAPIIQKRVKGRYCPWLTPELKTLMNNRDKFHRKARKTMSENDWNAYKQAKNHCNNAVKQAKYKYHHNLQNEAYNNPKKFWRAIKNIFPKSRVQQMDIHENDVAANSKTIANKFCEFFSTVAKTLKRNSLPLCNFTWSRPFTHRKRTNKYFKFKYVSKIYVEKQLKALKRGKSAGHDDIPPGLLKDAATELAKPLSVIINLSLKTGNVPSEWKIAKVIPIHKSGSKSSLENY